MRAITSISANHVARDKVTINLSDYVILRPLFLDCNVQAQVRVRKRVRGDITHEDHVHASQKDVLKVMNGVVIRLSFGQEVRSKVRSSGVLSDLVGEQSVSKITNLLRDHPIFTSFLVLTARNGISSKLLNRNDNFSLIVITVHRQIMQEKPRAVSPQGVVISYLGLAL